MKATIFNIQRYCIQDGPGVRTTVFFKGCPLRCVWCHNPESQKSSAQLMYYNFKCTLCGKCISCDARTINTDGETPVLKIDREKCVLCGKCTDICLLSANKISGYVKDTKEIFDVVMKDKIFYKDKGGMTLSGGEPAMQSEASLELLRLANEAGVNSVIETSGCGKPEFYSAAADLGASFYFDIKCIDDEKHKKLIGISNKIIHENLRILCSKGATVVLRLPLVPGFNDSEKDLDLLGEFLAEYADNIDHAEIMKYHILGSGKAAALGKEYNAPGENATAEQAAYWLNRLKEKYDNIIIS